MAGQRNISALRKLESLNDNDVFLVINKTGADSFEAKRMEWERVQVAVRAIVADFPRDTNTITVSKDVEGGILRFSVKDNTSTQKSIFHDGTNSSTRKEARFTSGPGIDVAVADNNSDDRADVTVKNTGIVDVTSNTAALTLSTNNDAGKKLTLGIDAGKIPINNLDTNSALAVDAGGTGAKTAEDARKNVGAAQSGVNDDITQLKALTTPLTVAQGGTGADDADESLANLKGLKEVKNAGNQGQSLIATESTNSNSVSYRAELKSISSQAASGIQVTTNGQVIEISSVPRDILGNLPEGATIDVNKVRFENASAPSKKDDLATRGYVDDLVANPDGGPVRVASTNEFRGTYIASNKHIVGVDELELFIDGVQLAVNDRVLLKDQSDQKLNGIYYVARTGSSSNNQQPILQRSVDSLESADIPAGRSIYVTEGKVNQASSFYQTTVDPIVDQKPLIFVSNTGLDVPVVVVSTNNIAATYSDANKSLLLVDKGRLIIDDYFLDTFDRVLIAGQTAKVQNGIYTVEARGGRNQQPLLTRASDALTTSDLRAGRSVYVKEGTNNKGKYFVQTQLSPIPGSGDLVFSLVSGGDGKADLSTSRDGSSVTIESSTGSNAVVGSASNSQAGVLTAADYVKLDDLAAGRNSSYLKSNAKATDSDQLDGNDSTYYLNASNISTGTLNKSRLPSSIDSSTTGFAATSGSADNSTKLNGQAASYYLNASNINDGTLSANRLPVIPEDKLPDSVKGEGTNLTSTVANSYVQINSSTGDDVKIEYATTNRAGVMSKDDYKKLDDLYKGDNTSYLKSDGTAADSSKLGGVAASSYLTSSSTFSADVITSGTLDANRLPTIPEDKLPSSVTNASDASKLNGQPGSFYQDASNINAGTLDAERLPNIPEDKLPASVKNVPTNLTSTVASSYVHIHSSTGDDVKIEYATTNRAGVMSKDDYKKLDDLYKGDNPSYLKSDAKAVDSDKLDGNDSTYYLNASNISTGTLNKSRLPSSIDSSTTGFAATSGTADNSNKLNGQPGSFYQNANNITSGTLNSDALPIIPASKLPASALNVPTNLSLVRKKAVVEISSSTSQPGDVNKAIIGFATESQAGVMSDNMVTQLKRLNEGGNTRYAAQSEGTHTITQGVAKGTVLNYIRVGRMCTIFGDFKFEQGKHSLSDPLILTLPFVAKGQDFAHVVACNDPPRLHGYFYTQPNAATFKLALGATVIAQKSTDYSRDLLKPSTDTNFFIVSTLNGYLTRTNPFRFSVNLTYRCRDNLARITTR